MSTLETQSAAQTRTAVYVRCSKAEYERLLHDTKMTGESAAVLLKKSYFSAAPLKPVLSKEDQKVLLTELMRQGNNINQIARKVNSGFREGLNEDLKEIRLSLTRIMMFLSGFTEKKTN